jgi:hypothetical protein
MDACGLARNTKLSSRFAGDHPSLSSKQYGSCRQDLTVHGEIEVKDRKSSQEYRVQLMGVSGFTRELPEFVSKSENGQNRSSTKARIRS